ncbi:flavodoxin-dependent (E)-4-hydroxy-3-methylbut-2-enyl-diphosphate synthase [bacterium]|nr:flavodoxin-dependent (E)-4-hydroxy-3-methylbut-2-enyl-diphosphate synthase [bacterium]
MINRRKSKEIIIGNIKIGGSAPVSVQSMCNTDTRDVSATLEQINKMAERGCELVRLAVLNKDAGDAIKDIVKHSPLPLIADIHFDYRLAIQCINNGINALRLNPGNIGKRENVEKVVKLAKQQKIPIRIGVNAGSLEKNLQEDNETEDKVLSPHSPIALSPSDNLAMQMVKSALKHIKILEDLDFDLIKVSLKSSDVLTTIEAYRLIAEKIPYPLHLGVTEAGTMRQGLIKSSVGLGTLLAEGIGDTIRVSLTEDPVEEVTAGFDILKSLNLRQRGVNFISCPTCGRTQINLIELAKRVEEKFKDLDKPVTIATMGCAVNGPGEARHADFGIAGGIGEGYIFKKGEIVARVPEEQLLEKLEEIIIKSSV